MRTFLTVCLCAVLLSTTASAQTMIPFRSGGEWGYTDADGKIIVPAEYMSVSLPADGFGLVCKIVDDKPKWGVMDSRGREILPTVYDYVDLCSEGMVAVYVGEVEENEEYGTCMTDGKWGFVNLTDMSGIDEFPYSVVGPYVDGVAWVSTESNGMPRQMRLMPIVNKKGKVIGENIIFGVSESFSLSDIFIPDESGNVVQKDGSWILVDRHGNAVAPDTAPYQAVGEFKDGLAWVKRGGLYGFVNLHGEEIIPIAFPVVQGVPGAQPASLLLKPENGTVRWVRLLDGQTAWIDESGEVVVGFVKSDGRVSVFDKVDESMWDF